MVLFIYYRKKLGLVGGGISLSHKKLNLHPCTFASKLSFKCLLHWVFRTSPHTSSIRLAFWFGFNNLCSGSDKSIMVIYFSDVGPSPHHTSAAALAKPYAVKCDKHRSLSRVACILWRFFSQQLHTFLVLQCYRTCSHRLLPENKNW